MLDFLKGKRKGNCIGSPCKGKAVALTEVPDPTFSEKILKISMPVSNFPRILTKPGN